MRHSSYRLHPQPSVFVPLNVRSAGRYRLEGGRLELRDPGQFHQLFWCVAGHGTFRLASSDMPFGPEMVFFYYPGEAHHIVAGPEGVEYCWLTLDGPSTVSMLQAFGRERIQESGPCPTRLFRSLDACLRDATAWGERKASKIAYEILLMAAAASPAQSLSTPQKQYVRAAKEILDRSFMDSQLDVAHVAERLGVHRSTLYRGFRNLYGVSPVQYLGRLRIDHALQQLKETTLPAADIAIASGLTDVSYLSRLLRQTTGFGPRALRKKWEK